MRSSRSRLSLRSEQALAAGFRAFRPPLRVAELALADLAGRGPVRLHLRATWPGGPLRLEAEPTRTTPPRELRLAYTGE